jgi:hypothetical protein
MATGQMTYMMTNEFSTPQACFSGTSRFLSSYACLVTDALRDSERADTLIMGRSSWASVQALQAKKTRTANSFGIKYL